MALFKQSYRDTLRQLKKEININTVKKIDTNNDPFSQFVIDISHKFSEITTDELYKKFHKKYSFINETIIKPHKNGFTQLIELMPSFFTDTNPIINDDFLTGYYLSKCHLIMPDTISSFHAGISSDGLLRGFYYGKFKNHEWSILGCDKIKTDEYKKIYINGIGSTCDIFDQNTRSSINIQLGEKIPLKSLNLYTADIQPMTAFDVLRMYVLAVGYVSNDGTIILRLPTNWKPFYTSMSTILLAFTHFYSIVKIFSAPWSDKRKYYLILSKLKTKMTNKLLINIHSYINCGDDNAPLTIKSFTDEYNDTIEIIKKSYNEFSQQMTCDSDNNIEKWVKLVSGN